MDNRRFMVLIPILMTASLLLTACGGDEVKIGPEDTGRINVVATTGMISDVVREVGGDRVEVVQMMGPGIDPHLYTATESDVDRLLKADMIFYNGINLEARLSDIFEQMAKDKPAVPVGEGIPEELILEEVSFNAPDPHIWMDVGRWILVVDVVLDELVAMDPEGFEVYQANAEAFREELEQLDVYVQGEIESIPAEQRVLVTAHDAFQYYGIAYGIEVFAPQGITTESEAGVDDIRSVIQIVSDRDIPAIFVESSVPPDVVEAIVEGASAAGHTLEIGGELFSDAMGEPGTPEGTYLGMIRHNTDTIVAALQSE